MCNNNRRGFFGNCQTFWIIVVIAIVVIWVHYLNGGCCNQCVDSCGDECGCGCNNNCGCC